LLHLLQRGDRAALPAAREPGALRRSGRLTRGGRSDQSVRPMLRPALLLLLLALLPTGARAVPIGYTLTPPGELDGTARDTSPWDYGLSGPRRDAVNTPDAIHLDGDGHLVIDTWTAADGTNYTGMIGTQGRFEQRYGYFEARIDFDGAPGMWSAFW